MIWLIVTVSAALLVYLMIRTMRQYEQESAAAAMEQVAQLTELTMNLEHRIENLEAIVTAVDVEPRETVGEGESPSGRPRNLRTGA